MSNIFFSSDQHFFHDKIRGYCDRPYSSVEEMNQSLIDNHNSIVTPEDLVYHLGDLSMSDKVVPDILKRLNGTHILIPGNHDKCHPANKKNKNQETSVREYLSYGFKEIHLELMQDIPGIGLVKFNHLPYNDPGHDDRRYDHLKPKPSGEKYLFHGHVHTSWKRRDNMINLGVDVWDYKPVSIAQIIEFLKE